MTALGTSFDNIRLIRRKIDIAEREVKDLPLGSQRDALMFRLSNLTKDLVRALHDFADMGYEEQVAQQIALSQHTSVRSYRN